MKTPDEIKKGLELCCEGKCSECPYREECDEHLACGGDMLPADVVLNDISALIQQLEAAQPKWISVEERLPEQGKTVNLLWKRASGKCEVVCGYRCLGFNTGIAFHIFDYNIYGWSDVTHWMPLPEPPKEV